MALRTAIGAARKKAAPVKKQNVAFEHNGKARLADLSITPLEELGTGADLCYLILFEEVTGPAVSKKEKKQKGSLPASDPVRKKLLDQTRELQAARVLLRENVAAQGALRESFQSTNEELLSANRSCKVRTKSWRRRRRSSSRRMKN
ncbi:MAG: hypothetical protein M3Y50_00840 [Acidobacteriota bacterium]|nr:hypothetical protein [Acidobacteriota bacterium]